MRGGGACRGRRAPVKLRILAQDPLVQALQVRGRVDAKLLGKPVPQRRVRGERLGLAAAPVQGEDPLPGEPFAQRMGTDQAVQFGDKTGVPAAGQVGVDPALQRGEPGLLEAAGVGLGEGKIGHVRQGRAPPQAQRRAQDPRGGLRPAPGQVCLCAADQALEAGGVQFVAGDVEPVAGRLRHQQAGAGAEGAAQPGDIDPQRGHAVWGRASRPQVIGEPVGRHDPVR